MKVPRRVAEFLASSFGYFWLPCPLCGQMFAGFEIHESARAIPLYSPPGIAKSVCRRHQPGVYREDLLAQANGTYWSRTP